MQTRRRSFAAICAFSNFATAFANCRNLSATRNHNKNNQARMNWATELQVANLADHVGDINNMPELGNNMPEIGGGVM